jgi:hypothetical protein
MPPPAFSSSTAISAECLALAPSAAAKPVSGAKNPTLTFSADAAPAVSATSAPSISVPVQWLIGDPSRA